jgi:hypothetical protein
MLDFVVGDPADGLWVEAIDRSIWERHQHWWVGGDHELRVLLLDHHLQHGQQPKLAHRRERRLRLIQQVQAVWNKAWLEQRKIALAMRVGIQIVAIPLAHIGQLVQEGHFSQAARLFRAILVLLVDRGQLALELFAGVAIPLDESEEILGTHEETDVLALAPWELQPLRQQPYSRQGPIAVRALAADSDRAGGAGQRLE